MDTVVAQLVGGPLADSSFFRCMKVSVATGTVHIPYGDEAKSGDVA